MKKFFICGIAALTVGMVSCKSRQKDTNRSVSETVNVAGTEKDIVEKYWKLTEVFGEKVVTVADGKDAYIILKQEDKRVNGNTGCNSLSGTYAIEAGNKIRFSEVVSTLMMCLFANSETAFKQVFETTDNFVVNGDTLRFYNANKELLACFEAVYL